MFVDWSQNNAAKTTVAPYSLRARPEPTVSTPVTWDEVESCRAAEDLGFTAPDVLARLSKHGDLFAVLHAQNSPRHSRDEGLCGLARTAAEACASLPRVTVTVLV